MFTVIIAEKDYLQKIEEYNLFLSPFLKSRDLVFCEWNSEKDDIAEIVPELAKKVGRRKDWRAVIICNDSGIYNLNPFDLVNYEVERFEGPTRGTPSDKSKADEYLAYLEREHNKKIEAYKQAAKNPLTKLVTYFCDSPCITAAKASAVSEFDPNYKHYIEENEIKQKLRDEILSKGQVQTLPPTEIYCIAKRTYKPAAEEFETVWSEHTELEYSRFYDRNMYFDKMRYLLFDILPKTQQGYEFDYIRFLYATMVWGSNEIPSSSLAPERIYKLECENDEEALSRLLQSYEYKMELTKDTLKQKIRDIQGRQPKVLSDKDVQQIFSAHPVLVPKEPSDVKVNDLFVDHSQIGLAEDCPIDENIFWDHEYKRSQKTLAHLLKMARRSVKKVVRSNREMAYEMDSGVILNEFQLEDVQEKIHNQEIEMLRTDVINLYEEKNFLEPLNDEDEAVKEKIKTRMTKKTTVILGALITLGYILGFITLFFKSPRANILNSSAGFVIFLVALGAFLVAGVVVLFFLRNGLVSKIKNYNNAIGGLNSRISTSVNGYAKYLSHINNIRNGYEILESAKTKQSPDTKKVILYKKHIAHIEKSRLAVKCVFGQFMEDKVPFNKSAILPYQNNYERYIEYDYPLPYSDATYRNITFIHQGTTTDVPVDFVKSLTVRREELYE